MNNPASSFWLAKEPLALASGSITRRKMLEDAKIPLEIVRAPVDEGRLAADLLAADANPALIAAELARAKLEAAMALLPNRLILAADQTLDQDGQLGMKSPTREGARDALRRLRGKRHHLHSAACLALDGKVVWQGLESAALTMRDFSDAFLEAYMVAMGDTLLDSVGGYQLEALGIHLFERVEGDHAVILGLPLRSVLDALRRLGALLV